MASLIDIEILEVKSPSNFTARLLLSGEQEAYNQAFSRWQEELKLIQESTVPNQEVKLGEIYAVRDKTDGQWQRVRVENVQHALRGIEASCFFVDLGKRQHFLSHRLYSLPAHYRKDRVPYQVRGCKLWGLKPLTMTIEITERGIQVPQRPTQKWDQSAEVYFRKLTRESKQAKVLLKEHEGEDLLVILYLWMDDQFVNINDILIREQYACALYPDTEKWEKLRQLTSPVSGNSTSISGRQQQQQQHDSHSINNSVNSPSLVTRGFDDDKENGEQTLTDEGLKHILSKVQRFTSQKKNYVDSEVTKCAQERPKVRTKPALGSRPVSRMDNSVCGSEGKQEVLNTSSGRVGSVTSPLSCSVGQEVGPHSDTKHSVSDLLKTTNSFRNIPLNSPSDSDSSSCQELQSYNCNRKSPEGLNKLKAHAAKVTTSGHVTHTASQGTSAKSGGLPTASSLPLTTSASGVKKPSEKAVVAGRGRGLRKLQGADLVKLAQAFRGSAGISSSDRTTGKAVDGKTMDRTSSTSKREGAVQPSAFRVVDQHAEANSATKTVDHLPKKCFSTSVGDSHTKPTAAGEGQSGGNCSVPSSAVSDSCAVSRPQSSQAEGRQQPCAQPPVSSHIYNPREIDVNHIYNPREVDLNLEEEMGMEQSKGSTDSVRSGSLSASSDSKENNNNQLKGELLIALLKSKPTGQENDRSQVKVPLVWRPDRAMPRPLLGTIPYGIQVPQPVYDVDEIQLNDLVKDYMLREEFCTPRAIQAHTWPALIRGRNIVGITPRHSGKTTAYLPPLVSELLKFSKYQKLPKGMGPKAVILVASCKKADSIHQYVTSMIENKTTLRVLSIYGSEDHHVMPLLRGCDLLIATPHCLLRMLRSRYTHLNRLCHLVLDGAEVLVNEFAKETNEVMQQYAEKLREFKSLPVPRQVMAFGTRWSSALAAFQRAYQPDPVLVFASRLEASVYGQVEQVVHMCFEQMHLATLKGLMEKLTDGEEHQRIIIVTTNGQNVAMIDQLLKSMSIFAFVVDFNASFDVIEDGVAHWLDRVGRAILVVTDDSVTELRLTNADTVVHFDIPNSQTKFGNRLALMMDHFQDRCSEPHTQQKRGVSHLLVTNRMLDNIQSLHSFLLRSNATIPVPMIRLLQGMHKGKNEDEGRMLCQQLKQFGQCRDENKCESRHLLLPCDAIQDGSPESWLPASGLLKVRILRVIDTTHYYAMLLENLEKPGQPRNDLQSRHTSMTLDLAMYLSAEANQVPFDLRQGRKVLAAVKDVDGLFHRARILGAMKSTLESGSQQLEVLYVDQGRKVIVRPDQLLKLPPKLQDVPPLAVEIFVCRVKPVDGDTEWTHSSTEYVRKLLKDKDLIGKIILRMKNTLWLDPLTEQTRLHNVDTNIISMIVRPDLLRRGFADDNPDHVKNLYNLCGGMIPIDQTLYKKYFNLQHRKEVETEKLMSESEFHDVFVSMVNDPSRFFVQKYFNQQELEKMDQEIQKYMAKRGYGKDEAKPPQTLTAPKTATTEPTESKPTSAAASAAKTEEPGKAAAAATASRRSSSVVSASREIESGREDMLEQGCLCLAKFSEDDMWYRSQILEKVEEEGWRVFFVDHGEKEVVPDSDIHPIPDQFCKLPAQAIECGLRHVRPVGEKWSENSIDLFWDLATALTKSKKRLIVKVFSTERAALAGATKYMIELYDTYSWGRDLLFTEELVRAHEAIAEEDEEEEENVKNLFPKVTFNFRKMYPNVDAKMRDMCAAVYWAEEKKKREQVCQKLCDIVGTMILNYSTTLGQKGLKHVVQLIGYLRSWDSQSAILSALVQCVKASPIVCGSVIGRELMLQLVFCLEQSRHPVVQLQAASAAAELAKIEGFTVYLDEDEIMMVMREYIVSEDPAPETLTHVCSFLAHMLIHGKWGMREKEAEELVPVVFEILAEIIEPDTMEMLLALLASIATVQKSYASFITREKHVQQILNLMAEAPSQRCVFRCAQICQTLCEAGRRHKRLLFEAGLVLVLKNLLEGGVQEPARQLCEDLVTLLAVAVPQQQELSGQFASSAQQAAAAAPAVIAPKVKWSQNSFRVLLTVIVCGAKESDFIIDDCGVCFRCESEGKVYSFEYELYDSVDPEKSRVIVHHGEVILSLCKEVKGKWKRLLKGKDKFLNLIVDYDKLVESSDSDLEDPENITMLSTRQSFPVVRDQPPSLVTNCIPSDEASDSESDSEAMLGSDSEDERFGNDFVDPIGVIEDMIHFDRAQKGTT